MHADSLAPPSAVRPLAAASIRNLPVSLFGSVMGLAGLGLAWRVAHRGLNAPAFIGEAIGTFALAVFILLSWGYLTKLAKHPKAVTAEFHHAVSGNFFGTVVLSILLLSAVVAPYSRTTAQVAWGVGVLSTFALSFVVVSRLLKGQVDASHAVPAWLIPGVATLDIPVTSGHIPTTWATEINLCAAAVGAVLALILAAMIVSRLVHRDPLSRAMTPTLMILVAPFPVGFLAYKNIVGGIDAFASLLLYFGLFMFAVAAAKVFRPGVGFSPTWWTISFPMAALANAALAYAEFRASAPLWILGTVLLGVLSLVVVVLTMKTVLIALNGKLLA